jgi:hypothetical protein
MDVDEVRELLKQKVVEYGSQSEFVRRTGCSTVTQVSGLLTGSIKLPARSVLVALGLKKIP